MNNFGENRFVDICDFICDNNIVLKKEFKEINDLIAMLESYALAYFNTGNFGAAHFKACCWKCNTKILEVLLKKIEDIKVGASVEFLQQFDIMNICEIGYEAILKQKAISLVWDLKKKMQYIVYEIDRIVKCNDKQKQVAILKGMIAYY